MSFMAEKIYSSNPMDEDFAINKRYAISMLKELHYKSQFFVNGELLAPFGDDYAYQTAENAFFNIEICMMIL
jgi:hypothetical protein